MYKLNIDSKFSFGLLVSRFLLISIITIVLCTVWAFAIKQHSVYAAPDTCNWTGAFDGDIANSANWSGCDNGNMPEAGDTIIFPDSATTKNITLNLAPVMANVQFTGNNYVVSPGTENLKASTFSFTGSATTFNFSANITLNDTYSSSPTISTTATDTFLSGVNVSSSSNVTLDVSSGSTLNIGLGIDGTAPNINKVGGGTLIINNAGNVNLTSFINSNGLITCRNSACFGDSSNSVVQPNSASAGVFRFENNLTLPYDFVLGQYSSSLVDVFTFEATNSYTFNGDISLYDYGTNASKVRFVFGNNAVGNFNGNISLQGNDNVLVFYSANSGAYANINGGIGGPAGSIVGTSGSYQLYINGSKSFDSDLYLQDSAILRADVDGSFGSTVGSTYVQNSGSVFFDNSTTLITSEKFVLNSMGMSGSGALSLKNNEVYLQGNITLTGNSKISVNNSNDLILNAGVNVSGNGNLTFENENNSVTGKITLDGLVNFNGNLIAGGNGNNLEIFILANANITASSINIHSNSAIWQSSSANEVISDLTPISLIDATSEYVMNGAPTETVRSVNGTGTIIFFLSGAHLRLSNASGNFTGQFSLPGTVTILNGSWNLLGATTTGNIEFIVNGGNLYVNSTINNSNVTVNSGGKLLGAGGLNDVQINPSGAINVGNSPGCSVVVNLTLSPLSVFEQEIDGNLPCSGYDQVTASDTVDLGGATLNVILGYTPTEGTQYTIINAITLTGTFAGLADNTVFSAGGTNFRINYDYPNGDVILTALDTPLSSTGDAMNIYFVVILLGISMVSFIVIRKELLKNKLD